MLGSLAVLWLSLAPPAEPAPASADQVIDIAPPSAPMPEPRPALRDEQQQQELPVDLPVDQAVQIAPSDQTSQSIQIASPDRPRRRRPVREPRPPRDWRRIQAKPWGKTDEWRKWGAPLLSAFVPGMGQLANGQVLKGIGLLYGTLAVLAGSIALYSNESDGTRPLGAEYARLSGYGLLSTGVPLMWIFAIVDAHRVAHQRTPEPKLDHVLRLSLARTMVVGFRADPDRPGFYDEWTGALIGQVARRWSVGLSDLTLKPDAWRIGVVQFGVRVDYRVFDRRRVWIDVAFGTAMQVKIRRGERPLDPEAPALPTQTKFAAIPYGQLDFRWFVADRISLDLVPRLSVPLTTRYYSADRALPRFAPTLELGASASVYF